MKNIKQELIDILTYFNNGLKDVEMGSDEEQPMQKRTEIALRRVKNLTIPDVSDSALNEAFKNGYKAAIDNLNACYKDIFD